MTSVIDEHSDKYNDPRVRVTRRGILIGMGIVLFGICGAALSIWSRRTRLEKSTAFWGPQAIEAMQLAAEMHLIADPPVRLTGMPGLGHLRHVLLDDRSYDWETERSEPITSKDADSNASIEFSDPEAKRFPDLTVVVDLQTGWVGDASGDKKVMLSERFRQAVPAFLKQIADYEPLRVERQSQSD